MQSEKRRFSFILGPVWPLKRADAAVDSMPALSLVYPPASRNATKTDTLMQNNRNILHFDTYKRESISFKKKEIPSCALPKKAGQDKADFPSFCNVAEQRKEMESRLCLFSGKSQYRYHIPLWFSRKKTRGKPFPDRKERFPPRFGLILRIFRRSRHGWCRSCR